MIRLTPFAETISGQELIKNEHLDLLTTLVQDKFTLSDQQIETVRTDLEKLGLDELKLLIRQILHFAAFKEFEDWVAEHVAVQYA